MSDHITLSTILDYIGANVQCTEGESLQRSGIRCLEEGEKLLRANHIICCGVLTKSNGKIDIASLCLQTSQISGKPHELRCQLGVNLHEGTNISNIKCSCKAGANGKCKHAVAMQLFLNKYGLNNLEDYSCTDLPQQWGNLKSAAPEMYFPVPVSQMCHVKSKPSFALSDELTQSFRTSLAEVCPHSALDKHQEGRLNPPCKSNFGPSKNPSMDKAPLEVYVPVPSVQDFVETETCQTNPAVGYLFDHMRKSRVKELIRPYSTVLCETCSEKYKMLEHANFTKICVDTLEQSDCQEWKLQRRVRITGSTCYSLFTYFSNENADWPNKIRTHFNSFSFKGNAATNHGALEEKNGIQWYIKSQASTVERFGLVIHPDLSWLGFSPDGVVFNGNKPIILLEVKAPIDGKMLSASNLNLKYVTQDKKTGRPKLRVKHKYYGQVQLGMALLNVPKCHLIVYASFDDSAKLIEVDFDPHFVSKLLSTLHTVYFKYLLPGLCNTWNCNSV